MEHYMLQQFKARTRHWIDDIAHSASSDSLAAVQYSLTTASPSLKASQVQLYTYYQGLAKQNQPLPSIFDTGYRVCSEAEEDGMLVFLFAVLGTKNKTFVDIGAANGINSNCANLAINFGWHGLFIDGSEEKIEQGKKFYSTLADTSLYPPKFICARVTRENVNQLISNAGFQETVDLVSIDIDGNDYWVWDALECIRPRVVIIETHIEFGYHNIVVPYDKDHVYPGNHPDYHGASAVAMVKLANRLGYRLVGANRFGFNTIYVAKEEGAEFIPEVSVEAIIQHPRNQERFPLFEAIRDRPFIEGGSPYPGRPATVS
jgi:hypothetical protein